MSYPVVESVTITTNTSGAATSYTGVVRGEVSTIKYVKDDYANGVDFTITTEDTEQNLWVDTNINASETVCPRQPTHDATGAASLYAAAGEPVEAPIYACGERIKIVIAQGGDTKAGTFKVVIV